MTAAPKPSRVATAGSILAALTCGLAVLDATTLSTGLLPALVVLAGASLAVCGIGLVACLVTGRPGAGRAILGGAVILVPAVLVPTMT